MLVDLLHAYLNRGGLLHDLREARRQLSKALSANDVAARSVKTVAREHGGQRRLTKRQSDEQVRELTAAVEAGATRMKLAERYKIGRTSVAKLPRAWRESQDQEGAV
ncbi:MAG: hypothetical protein LC799_06090 [Actinobacteria bacterium]|nr:hypothetical protein [Actinomycetota bacterium]